MSQTSSPVYDYFVIFGAAVRPDGSPSGTLRRRVEGAYGLAIGNPRAKFLPTGGQGKFGPAEALVMRDLLVYLGVKAEQIIPEDQAGDTLTSVQNCAAILRRRGDVRSVTVCSSPYHNPRCQILLRLLGIPARRGRMPSDRPALGTKKWIYYWFRDMMAIPFDVVLLLLSKLRFG